MGSLGGCWLQLARAIMSLEFPRFLPLRSNGKPQPNISAF